MGFEDEGYALFAPGDSLLEFTIVDLEKNIRESVFCPRDSDIRKLCIKHNVDVEAVSDIIWNKRKDVHTLLIDINKFKEHLRQRGDVGLSPDNDKADGWLIEQSDVDELKRILDLKPWQLDRLGYWLDHIRRFSRGGG